MLFIYYSFLIEFNSRQLDVGNYNSNDERLCNLLNISKRVNKSYLSVTTRYSNMAINNGWLNNDGSIWPIDVNHLLEYIAIIHKTISPSTLVSYLSALSDKHSSLGINWKYVRENPSVIKALKIIKQNYSHKPTKKAELITRLYLRYMLINLSPCKFDDLLFLAIAFSAFYSLARLGELIQSNSTPTKNTLYMNNIS